MLTKSIILSTTRNASRTFSSRQSFADDSLWGENRHYDNQSKNKEVAYGDQRTHYTQQNLRDRRVGGDTKFNYQQQRESIGGFGAKVYNRNDRFNVSGYTGRQRMYGAGESLRAVDYRNVKISPVKKNVYEEHPNVAQRSVDEVNKFLEENQVTIEGEKVPRPVFDFIETSFPEKIVNILAEKFDKPMAIQSVSWPIALSGRDIISIGRTGSGKTLGFILPGIVHTLQQHPRISGEGPRVVVILPTRELARQVEEVASEYARAMNLSIHCFYGGSSKIPQINALRHGIDICIATPGRLLDLLAEGATNMLRCSYLVLDEADRMLDMGFEPQIRKIVSQIRPDRQTLMFSATWPKEVRALAQDFQEDPIFLNVGSMELSANHNIQQHVEVVDEFSKKDRLFELMQEIMKQDSNKTLIFVETKRKADELTRALRKEGIAALALHGDKSQAERDWVMQEFRAGKAPVLIATDVAARGLDVNDIKIVINFDYPNSAEDYVHRIGRTGRRDKKGVSYTFFTSANGPKAKDLIKVLQETKQNIPQKLSDMPRNDGGDGFSEYGGRGNNYRGSQSLNRGGGYGGTSRGYGRGGRW